MKERFLFLITILLILCSFSVLALGEYTTIETEVETTEYETITEPTEKIINPEIEQTLRNSKTQRFKTLTIIGVAQ